MMIVLENSIPPFDLWSDGELDWQEGVLTSIVGISWTIGIDKELSPARSIIACACNESMIAINLCGRVIN